MMATISIKRFTLVLPVPVTPLSQMFAMLINNNPKDTTLMTGMPAATKLSSWPNRLKNMAGNKFSKIHILGYH